MGKVRKPYGKTMEQIGMRPWKINQLFFKKWKNHEHIHIYIYTSISSTWKKVFDNPLSQSNGCHIFNYHLLPLKYENYIINIEHSTIYAI